MTILVTGVAGLIGSNFARWALQNTTERVVGVDDLSCGLYANIPTDIDAFYKASIGRDDIGEIFEQEKPDIVYHFAAYAAEGLSPFIRTYNYRNNLLATADIVNCCINHDVQRLIFTSSMAVYGSGDPPFDEVDHCHPIDPYGNAKLACERDIQIAGEQHGLDWCIIRPHNVYGPGQVCDQQYRNVLTIWMSRYRRSLPLRVYGDGSQRRAFSYVEDILPCLHRAGVSAESNRQIINLGGKRDISIRRAAEMIAGMLPGATIEHMEPRHEVRYAWCTTEKSERVLGYEERVPLEIGLESLWQWVRDQPIDHAPPAMEMEVTRGLYSFWAPAALSISSI